MQTYPTGYAESHHIAEQIFREILPRRGMAVREEQIALCHEVLDTLYNKEISLCEAGVGTGKTLAYLVGCILWQMHRPERMKLPIVISTSSVALQDAILTEYLPDLSAILLDEGIITAPITAVVRKGKERFVCDARLAERQAKAISKGQRQKGSLRMAENVLDLDHIPGLSRYDRCRICVPQSCPRDCFLRLDCRYQQYLRDSRKPDIQICNHNYLLANASHRLEERPLLLRQYQALVVDEAHKLLERMTEIEPEHTSTYLSLANVCYMQEDYPAMAGAAKKAIEIEEGNAMAHYLLGKADNGQGDGIMCIAHLTKAIVLKDDFIEARLLRAEALVQMQQYKEAMEDIDTILAQDPEDESAILLRGKIEEATGNKEKAESSYQKVTELNPFNEQAFLYLGQLYITQNKLAEAIELFTEATELNPNFAEAYHERGRAKLLNGDKEGSAEDMKKGLELNPKEIQNFNGQYGNQPGGSTGNILGL